MLYVTEYRCCQHTASLCWQKLNTAGRSHIVLQRTCRQAYYRWAYWAGSLSHHALLSSTEDTEGSEHDAAPAQPIPNDIWRQC